MVKVGPELTSCTGTPLRFASQIAKDSPNMISESSLQVLDHAQILVTGVITQWVTRYGRGFTSVFKCLLIVNIHSLVDTALASRASHDSNTA
jgi:hypothetical protein